MTTKSTLLSEKIVLPAIETKNRQGLFAQNVNKSHLTKQLSISSLQGNPLMTENVNRTVKLLVQMQLAFEWCQNQSQSKAAHNQWLVILTSWSIALAKKGKELLLQQMQQKY